MQSYFIIAPIIVKHNENKANFIPFSSEVIGTGMKQMMKDIEGIPTCIIQTEWFLLHTTPIVLADPS